MVGSLLSWFAAQARDLPWRRTHDPYAIWVSEVMLQQTQVTTVIPYWERWMREWPDVRALAEAPLDRVLKLWEGLGYYRRARNLHGAAGRLVREREGRFPRSFEDILALPGVGRYTAGAICSLAFNHPTPVVDGNVTRVLARVLGLRQNVQRPATQRRLWTVAGELVEAARDWRSPGSWGGATGWRRRRVKERPCGALNEALMELGAVVCVPQNPRCELCPLRKACVAHRLGLSRRLPVKGRSARTSERREYVFVCERQGRWLVRQRPAGVVNEHLWEFPGLAQDGHASPLAAAQALLGTGIREVRPWMTVRQSITRHRYVLAVCRVQLGRGERGTASGGRWLSRAACEERAFSAGHRKILQRLGEGGAG
ncbi:MAG: A/G-specific adenine glycosylase [Verrucomicrobiales bacterium]|nr:A/G-specific adenine glycosylase [Verrucomicrobiales bacterium]